MQIKFTHVLIIFLLIPGFAAAQDDAINYTYTSNPPEFEPTGNLISIYQAKTFSVLQSHPPKQKPDFIPSNTWEYYINGDLSDSRLVLMHKAGDRQFLVEETPVQPYRNGMIFTREEMGQTLYTIEYSNLKIKFTPLQDAAPVAGLKTRQTVLTINIMATVRDNDGKISHRFDGTFIHRIRLSSDIPFSSAAYSLLQHADTPWWCIEPENYQITNNRPWLVIGNMIYDRFVKELEPKGMVVKMNSSYTYSEQGKVYQTAQGSLQLKSVNPLVETDFQPKNYPLLAETTYDALRGALKYSQPRNGEIPNQGQLDLSSELTGKISGNAIYQQTRQYFAIRAEAKTASGRKLNLVFLKVNTDLPESGKQQLTKAPVSSIRETLRQGPLEGFEEQFFVGGVLEDNSRLIGLLHVTDGSLGIDQVSEDVISGNFNLHLKAVDIEGSQAHETDTHLKGSFRALEAD